MTTTSVTATLPPRTTARDLYNQAAATAEVGVTFLGDEQAPRQWWNWYMSTPDWDDYFVLQTVPPQLAESRPDQYPASRRAALRPAKTRRQGGEDLPLTWSASAHIFLSAVVAELTKAGCPDLRGSRYTI